MPRERERERRKSSRKESAVSRNKSDQRHRLREKTSRALEKMTAQDNDEEDWRTDQDDLRSRKKQFKPCSSSGDDEIKLKYWCRVIAYVEIVMGFIRLCIAFGFFSAGAQKELFRVKFPVIELLETIGYIFEIICGVSLFIGASCMRSGYCVGHCIFSVIYILLNLTTFFLVVTHGRFEGLQSQSSSADAIFWLHGLLPFTLCVLQVYFAWCSCVLSNHIDFGDRMEEIEKHNRLKSLIPKVSKVKDMSKIDLLL